MNHMKDGGLATEHKLKQHRALLLESVRAHLLPRFIERGFVGTDIKDRNYRDSFPLGRLRRSRPDGGVDVVEIQFQSDRRAAFRINACAVPREGMMTAGGWRTAEEIDAGGLHDHFELYASPQWRRWFSLPFWSLRAPDAAKYERLALEVATFLPEVELALREGKLGPHMRKIVYPVPPVHTSSNA